MAIKPEDVLSELKWMRNRVQEARKYLNFDGLRAQIARIEDETVRPGFWDDPVAAQEQVRRLSLLKSRVEPWAALERDVNDTLELSELAENDPAMEADLLAEANRLSGQLEALETRALMSDPADANPSYLYIHAGAGGTESCDWAQMLLRMYARWCERHDMKVTTIEMIEGEEAGIRSVTLLVEGEYAYGQLKGESGIHRLVRISPFDANKRRHTSFCSIYAWPQVDDTIEVDIKDEDIKIDTFRASGAGGQHVNKTSSAIRITHLPTKIVVQCQNERSQHQNKATALKMLRSRLYQFFLEQRQAEQAEKESQKKDISWGNQIRSYVFQPYQLVKDHRTGEETGNIIAVMDGDIDRFIEAYLRWAAGMPQQGKEGVAASLDLPE
ncbi:MAG: peptide chain release factor 2 [bacterium]|nr:peptide chain release factor 2 [bacterium]